MISDGAIVAICAAIAPVIIAVANLVQILKVKDTTNQIHSATNGGLKDAKDKLAAANLELDQTYSKIRVLEAAAKAKQEEVV